MMDVPASGTKREKTMNNGGIDSTDNVIHGGGSAGMRDGGTTFISDGGTQI